MSIYVALTFHYTITSIGKQAKTDSLYYPRIAIIGDIYCNDADLYQTSVAYTISIDQQTGIQTLKLTATDRLALLTKSLLANMNTSVKAPPASLAITVWQQVKPWHL